MRKKWLWIVCIGLICCSSLAYVFAKQITDESLLRTERDVRLERLADIREQMASAGESPELKALEADLLAQLYPEKRQFIDDATIARLAKDAMTAEVKAAQESKAEVLKEEALKQEALNSSKDDKTPDVSGYVGVSNESDGAMLADKGAALEAARLQHDADISGVDVEYARALQESGMNLSEEQKAAIEREDALRNEEANRGNERNPLDTQGGPDTFGYRWVDDAAGDTTQYSFVDIAGAGGGTQLTTLANVDGANVAITPSFAFPFYGVNRSTMYVGSDGYISMTAVTSFSNTCTLPTTTFPSGCIMPFWDDTHTGRGGTGVSATVSDSGSVWWKDEGNRIIVQWDSVGRFSPSFQHTMTFQAILYSDGKIKFQWREISRYAPSVTYPSATIAIQQGTGGAALAYKCNASADITFEALGGHAVWFYIDPAATGRCCYLNGGVGSCADNSASACAALGGSWGGYTTTCAANPCPTGRCCYLNGGVGSCSIVQQIECNALTGVWTAGITDCVASPCPTGRCCYLLGGVGTCTINQQAECTFLTGTWTSGITSCTTSPCPTGRCCYLDAIGHMPQCATNMQLECTALAGTWLSGSSCATVCPIGRCCYNAGASCENTTVERCTFLAGTFTAGQTCEANPCPISLPGGETCADAVLISVGPVYAGTTVGGIDDDPNIDCGQTGVDPYVGSNTAPDKWYRFVGTGDSVNVSMCSTYGTAYDSQILVVCGTCTSLLCVAGGDDNCGTQSQVNFCTNSGTTYYICVDGWASGSGAYGLRVSSLGACVNHVACDLGRCCYNGGLCCAQNTEVQCTALGGSWLFGGTCAANPCTPQCVIACQGTDILEGAEADSARFGPWDPNGGCNSDSLEAHGTPSWGTVACNDTVCGNSFYYTNTTPAQARDTDWFRFTVAGPDSQTVTWSAKAEYSNVVLYIISGTCATTQTIVAQNGATTPCGTVTSATATCLPPGDYWAFVALPFPAGTCPSLASAAGYRAWLTCTPCVQPLARCCYNGGASCTNTSIQHCQQVLAGTWTAGFTCEANPCPLNLQGGETCAQAVPVVIGGTYLGTTVGALDDDPGFQCALGSIDPYEGSNTAGDVWYSFVGQGDSVTVTLCDATGYDQQILVICQDCAAPICVAGNDDATCAASGVRSTVKFGAQNGQTYKICVDGWGAATGSYVLQLIDGPAASTYVNCNPSGRCCYLNLGVPSCADVTASECSTLGGLFTAGTTCAAAQCPTGRCCYQTGGVGQCAVNFQIECNVLGGVWTSGSTCATLCPTGRCCYVSAGLPACLIDQQSVCTFLGGTWTSGLTSCVASPCPTGRCCYNANASCLTTTTEHCTTLGGTWNSSMNCEDFDCPIIPINDECNTATVVTLAPFCTAEYYVNLETATGTCDETTVGNGETTPEASSTGPDVFYRFTLTECRRIAIKASGPNSSNTLRNSHISVKTVCCDELTYVLGNDDYAANNDLPLLTWLPADNRPLNTLGSMVAGQLPAGTYYVRAGLWSTTTSGQYTLTFYDYGPCVDIDHCVPGDYATNVTVHRDSLTPPPNVNPAGYVTLRWLNVNPGDFKIWSSINPANDGDPDGPDPDLKAGDDPMFTLETTLLGLSGGANSWARPAGFESYINFVVTPDCDPTPTTGRCCYLLAGTPSCTNNLEAQCTTLGGEWTANFTCECAPCPAFGRCCYNLGANCQQTTLNTCNGLTGTWNSALVCGVDPCPIPPANDLCSGAILVPIPSTTAGTTVLSNPETGIPACGSGYTSPPAPAVWYRVVGNGDSLRASMCTTSPVWDSELFVFCGTCAGFTCIGGDDDFCSSFGNSQLNWAAVNGVTYYIMVTAFSATSTPAEAPFTLAITDLGPYSGTPITCP